MVVHYPRGGPVTWHPRFLDCARFHGFDPKAAEVYRAQTQGKIERPIRYVRGHVWPRLRTVDDLPDLNRQATHWVATVADARVHQTTEGSPASRRPADVAALTAWTANHPCAFGSLRPRRVQLDGTVRADGHAWRVPPEYVGQEVFVQRTRPGGLRVLRGETVLMEHRCPAFPHEVMTGDLPPVVFRQALFPLSSRKIPHRSDLLPEKWTPEKFPRSPHSDTGGETRHPLHPRPDTQAVKLPVIRAGLEDHQTVRAVARPCAVAPSRVRDGLHRSDEGGEPALHDRRGPPDPRPPRRLPPGLSLAEDNAGLQAENAYLKKWGPGKGGTATTGPLGGHRDRAGSVPPRALSPGRGGVPEGLLPRAACPIGRP